MYHRDGHIHSPYCPHGSSDSFKQYIERGIQLGYSEMTFTEHAPLPEQFVDPVPLKDSGMKMAHLEKYIDDLTIIKKEYENDIKINIGLEVDYIEGYEKETTDFLHEWGDMLDDSILSVHFIQYSPGNYICLDYSPDSFKYLIDHYSSLETVYQRYFDTLNLSITSELGPFKPKRIGHITLVRKFQELFPRTFEDNVYIQKILKDIKNHNYSLDVNGAGLIKPHCKEIYPPLLYIHEARKLGIPLIYGSDAHAAKQLGQGLAECKHILY
ncbi:histidinol-phosphatase HisJ [Evansella sp. AB-rgal1]|uniref:histidinol-phosphatase HisJ n=1 Tax=Evansella sp. AB-rgal1 TaxID=3242696 RepID=UPI00359D97EC